MTSNTTQPSRAAVQLTSTKLFADDFRTGLNHEGHDATWMLRPVESFPDGDGRVHVTPGGIVVEPTGTNDRTGEAAFAVPEGHDGPTQFLRWATFTTAMASSGVFGFDLPPGGEITGSVRLGAQVLGAHDHPLGEQVSDPDADMRLGAAALVCIDMETGLVLDLVLTNNTVYALYERLPRPDSDHAMFSYSVPIGPRTPEQEHLLEVSISAAGSGCAVWRLDGREVLRVDRLGLRCLDRRYLLRESDSGTEELVAPRQINFGLATFASGLWGQGVRLAASDLDVSVSSHF